MKPYTLKQRLVTALIAFTEFLVNSSKLNYVINLISRLIYGKLSDIRRIKVNNNSMFRNLHVAFIADGNRRFDKKIKAKTNAACESNSEQSFHDPALDFLKENKCNESSIIRYRDTRANEEHCSSFLGDSKVEEGKENSGKKKDFEQQILDEASLRLKSYDLTKISNMVGDLKAKRGSEKIIEIIKFAYLNNLKEVSFYCFSIKNYGRDKKEVNEIMNFIKNRKDFGLDIPFKINIYGDLDLLEEEVRNVFQRWVESTKHNDGLTVNIFFSYLSSTYKNKDNPFNRKVDVLIRTGGERRLSDFMVENVASGTAVEFLKPLWPEFSLLHLWLVLFKYKLEEKFLCD